MVLSKSSLSISSTFIGVLVGRLIKNNGKTATEEVLLSSECSTVSLENITQLYIASENM